MAARRFRMGEGMKDQADKQTQPLPLEQPKRGRGRPSTGAAMTPAEKQRAYRERQKSNVTDNGSKQLNTDQRILSLGVYASNLEDEIKALKAAQSRLIRGFYVECLEPKCRKWKRWSQHEAMSLDAADTMVRCLEGADDLLLNTGMGGSKFRYVEA